MYVYCHRPRGHDLETASDAPCCTQHRSGNMRPDKDPDACTRELGCQPAARADERLPTVTSRPSPSMVQSFSVESEFLSGHNKRAPCTFKQTLPASIPARPIEGDHARRSSASSSTASMSIASVSRIGIAQPWWHAARTPSAAFFTRYDRNTRLHPRGRSLIGVTVLTWLLSMITCVPTALL